MSNLVASSRTVYNWYKKKVQSSHGRSRYNWEHVPILSQVYGFEQGGKKAQDYYDNTGKDDYYGTGYMDNSLNSALGALSAPLPGVRLPTMAKSLAKMYGAEVELNIAKVRRDTARLKEASSRNHMQSAQMWSDYQKHKKYNDW